VEKFGSFYLHAWKIQREERGYKGLLLCRGVSDRGGARIDYKPRTLGGKITQGSKGQKS